MPNVMYDRILRSNVVEHIEASGASCELRPSDDAEPIEVDSYYLQELRLILADLHESVFSKIVTRQLIAEALDVLDAIRKLRGVSKKEVEEERKKLADKFGTYDNPVIVMRIFEKGGGIK